MSEKIYVVTEQEAGQRLDQFLKEASGLTRSEVQKWIKDGRALLADGKMIRPNYHVQTGDQISFSWEEKKEIALIPQDIPLDILYEDEHMLVINKARGMVVHPGSGNPDGTLVNALLFHVGPSLFEACEDPIRPGIVHRLDKDTSGVMVVAKSKEAFPVLKEEIATHEAERHYACQTAEKLSVKNLVLYHTEDKNIARRRELYTAEGQPYFSGNLYVPDDLDVIEL